jgi:hypothetical protein
MIAASSSAVPIPASQGVGDVGKAKKVISLTDVDKWYGTVQVLKNISLSVGSPPTP